MQTEGFIQPQSYEAETSVLGAVLEDSTLLGKIVDNLYDPKIFYHERHQLLWSGAIVKILIWSQFYLI